MTKPQRLLDEAGSRSGMRGGSNKALASGYGRWLTFLSTQGVLDPDTRPADRITLSAVSRYLQELRGQVAPATQLRRLLELRLMAELLAPEADWGWLREITNASRRCQAPTRNKRAKFVSIDKLAELGLQLIKHAEEDASLPSLKRALMYRDGLAIALLAYQPLRRANFVGMRFGTTFVLSGERWWYRIDGEHTKNHQPIDAPCPVHLNDAINIYRDVWRFVLIDQYRLSNHLSAAGDAVWVSCSGTAMGAQALYDLVCRHTCLAFSRTINPHMFRVSAVSTLTGVDPEYIDLGSGILGHRHKVSTERSYNLADNTDALRNLQKLLDERRQSGQSHLEPVRRTTGYDD